MEKYRIKQVDKGYQIITPGGYIANDYTHKSREEAEKHLEILETFYGEGRWTQSKK